MKTYYVTTPIYYLNDKFHIGHTYTSVAADAIARYKRARGYDVKFLTGTDDHGQKVERAAEINGVTPKEHVDALTGPVKELWKAACVDYDIYIRTTDGYHMEAVKKIFKALLDKGELYKGEYSGLYCTPCETFFTERELEGGKCPECGRAVETVTEECYFFRLSKYAERIMRHFDENPGFLLPEARRNEMLNTFLRPGLEDLCVSRTTFKWGVPVDFDRGTSFTSGSTRSRTTSPRSATCRTTTLTLKNIGRRTCT